MSENDLSRCDVLVLGDLRQTLTVVRSLGRAGYRVILGRSDVGYANHKSRYVADVWEYPPAVEKSPHQFAEILSQFLESHPQVGCVFPVGEKQISLLTNCRDELPDSVAYAMPCESIVETCLDKTATLKLLGDLGVPLAKYQIAADQDELKTVIEDIGYPCIIKPETEQSKIFGKKALILNSREELDAVIDDWPKDPVRWIVQKYFAGERRNVYFFARRGQLLSSVEVNIGRTDRVDGTGYAVEDASVEPSPDLLDYTRRLIESLDYNGVGCTQFLVDENNKDTTFLEINARLGANFAIAYSCGLDLPRWMVESVLGFESQISPTSGVVGKRYYWLYGDIQGFKHALAKREATAIELLAWPLHIARSWFLADTHVTWDWRDPLPTLTKMAEMFTGPLRRLAAVFNKIPRAWAYARRNATATGHEG